MTMEETAANNNNNGSQDLETEFAERSVWLMKCPSLIAPSFEPLPFEEDPYLPVAKVILSIDPLAIVDEEETKVVMELTRAESGNVPKRFGLDVSKDFIPMSAFPQSSQGRTMSVIDNATGMHMRPTPGTITPTGFLEKKKVANKTSEMKRTRRGRREMEEVMLNLFEGHSNWTLRLLIQETDQPEQFLKDLLRDLCIYNNKGSNQGTYELKPEYKKATHE
ncbi:BnaC07g32780D [Brassica napus]|uniref:BnaC07g32780D protein n=2 Tax=Brassica TaxID=3705 RepID=A0A078GVD3_BRANA|nr:BnaC07g32780D [Brassica napus]VDD39643.1 unnamed protein product [Brassica oleracea]